VELCLTDENKQDKECIMKGQMNN